MNENNRKKSGPKAEEHILTSVFSAYVQSPPVAALHIGPEDAYVAAS